MDRHYHSQKKKTKREEKFENTEGVIRSCKSKKNRQHNGQSKKTKREEKFEDTEGVSEYTNHCTTGAIFYSCLKCEGQDYACKSKDRQHNSQKKKDNSTN